MEQRSRAAIVVGYNGSAAAVAAARWGFDHCVRTGRRLILAYDSGESDPSRRPGGGEPIDAIDPVDDGIVDQLRNRHSGSDVPIETAVGTQSPSIGLLERSAHADLLVLGGEATPHPRLLGALTEHLAATALCPVAAISPAERSVTAGADHVAVGVTDSVAGLLALEFAVAEAIRMGCSLTAVVSNDFSEGLGGDPAKTLRWIHSSTATSDLEITVQTVHPDDRPADVLIDVSATAAITVVGSHHSNDPWSIRLGPVAEAVLRLALSPVVLVGHRRRPRDLNATEQLQ